ncbi:MAG: phospholipase A [Gemmatimonadales bacterium]|nr:phospholipase A [Gemmatimonadales bacterium]
MFTRLNSSRCQNQFPSALLLLTFLLLLATFQAPGAVEATEEREKFFIGQFQSERFSMKEPNYFLFGFARDNTLPRPVPVSDQVRFKVSIQYLAIGKPGYPNGLFGAFTQDTFWNIYDKSAPIYDTNFIPELFFRHGFVREQKNKSWNDITGLRFGVRHHSNGRDEYDSRSWNRIFGTAEWGNHQKSQLYASASLWHVWSEGGESHDTYKYLGRGELRVDFKPLWKFNYKDLATMGMSLRVPILGRQIIPAVELALYVGLIKKSSEYFAPSVMIQYYDGYGYTLLDYKQHVRAIRVGFATVR